MGVVPESDYQDRSGDIFCNSSEIPSSSFHCFGFGLNGCNLRCLKAVILLHKLKVPNQLVLVIMVFVFSGFRTSTDEVREWIHGGDRF